MPHPRPERILRADGNCRVLAEADLERRPGGESGGGVEGQRGWQFGETEGRYMRFSIKSGNVFD